MSSFESHETASAWQRVSPISLFYFAFSAVKHILNMWPALIGIFAISAGNEDIQQFILQYGVATLVVIFLLALWTHYWFFRFKEDEDRIQIRTGLINRKRLTLYFERVQQADIIQPFYFRPFALSTLGLESAGSGQQEVEIPGIPYQTSQQLKKKILRFKKQQSTTDKSETEKPQEAIQTNPKYQLQLPPLEVARYGLMHNGLLFLLPVLGAFSQQSGNFIESAIASLQETWFFNTIIDFTYQAQGWLMTLAVLFLLFAGVGSLFGISMVIALVRFWNYDLVHRGDQFQYRAGLGTVKTRGFRLHKLQKITISQGVVARILQRYSVVVSKTGSNTQPGQELHNEAKKFIVPVLNKHQLSELLCQLNCSDVFEPNSLGHISSEHGLLAHSPPEHAAPKKWAPISRFYIIWWGAWIGLIAAGLATAAILALDLSFWLVVIIFSIIVAIVWRHWYCYGVCHNDEWLAIRSGFIGRKIVIVPNVKTQKVAISQPPWLRQRSLANLMVWSGGGLVTVPYLPQQVARDTRDRLLDQVVTYRGHWF